MIDLSTLEPREIIKGFKGRFVHTENATLAFWEVEKGAVLPVHSHIHEQTTQVLEGRFQLTIGDVTNIYTNGFVAVISSNVVHSGIALTDCRIFDVFCPVREDYK